MDPFRLAWTQATIEQYSDQLKAGVHVFGHDLSTPEAIGRTLRFAIGRAQWFKQQLPPGTSQGAWLDDRGQSLSDISKKRIREALSTHFVSVIFMSEKVK
jgi:hypothetical protein